MWQVRAKGQSLVRLLQQGDAACKAHATLSLATRLLGQCEAQVLACLAGQDQVFCAPAVQSGVQQLSQQGSAGP